MFSQEVQSALDHDLTIDITTTGRRSGRPRTTEIWYHRFDGRYFITGTPGRRDWYANLQANPEFTFHLKESARADLPARARLVTDAEEKRRVLLGADSIWDKPDERTVEEWVRHSPMVEVIFENGGGE
jgi:deazaflavin-dependent oxidoreductase (nitroreductase family)